jgi:TipAS antibiotic-recognition domain
MESIEMQPHEEDFMKKYYTDEAWAKRIAITTQTSPQTLEAYRQKWKQLFLEVEAGLDLDPASEAAQLLARRWVLLAEAMSKGDSGIKAGAIDAWKDHRNWPLAEQEALFARYGLESSSDRNACMMRLEKVANFIGKAIGRKYAGSLAPIRFTQAETSLDEGRSKRWVELFRDAESALADGPASERAQGLVARWTELKLESEAKQSRNVSRLGGFQEVLGNNPPSHTPVAVVNQVARLYRIEQVSQFLESALERISGRDSA